MKLRYTRRALRHLDAILSYIARDSLKAAALQIARIENSIELLERFPHMGHEGRAKATLELVVPTTSYIVVYRLKQDEIQILSVLHGKQRRPPP